MKQALLFSTLLIFLGSSLNASASICTQKLPLRVDYCEPTTCDCKIGIKTLKEVSLYGAPDKDSLVIATLKKGTAVETTEPLYLVTGLGKGKLTPNPIGESFSPKEIKLVRNIHEGLYEACDQDKAIEVGDAFGPLLEIEKMPEMESWVKVRTHENQVGYTPRTQAFSETGSSCSN